VNLVETVGVAGEAGGLLRTSTPPTLTLLLLRILHASV